MSQLNFSAQLVQELQQVLRQHDETANDPGIAAHYLAASMGFLLAASEPDPQKQGDKLQSLLSLSVRVIQDINASGPAPEQASGVWKPE